MYQVVERNEMTVRDVLVDSRFATEGGSKLLYVVALKRCGCTGPLVGRVEAMTEAQARSAVRRGKNVSERPEDETTLWVAYPVLYERAVAYAWGSHASAQALCRWWGVRNIRGRLHRSEEARMAHAEQRREKTQRLMAA